MLKKGYLKAVLDTKEQIKSDTQAIRILELRKQENLERLRAMKKPRLGYIVEYLALMKEFEQEESESKKAEITKKAQKLELNFNNLYKVELKPQVIEFKKQKGIK